jgi:RNA polymerase sigma factor (sigma-70 family)
MTEQTLAQLLASLPEEERIILTLHYLRSLSAEQIAQILSVPERSVVTIIISGRARLTQWMEL